MTVEMRKQVSWLLAPTVFIMKSLVVSLCLRQNVVSCLLWVVKRELVLSVLPDSQHFSNGKAVDEMVLVLLSSLLLRGLGIKSWLHSC